MKKKMIYVVATLMLVAVSVVNVKTVLDANRSYDLTMTSIDALSENGDGEGGGGDGSGENDGGGKDQESNNDGFGQFYYKHLQGRPDECTLYRHVHINGNIVYSDDGSSLGADWETKKVKGVKEICPDKGSGCTVYSCQITN